ncbi:MAG TPA: Gfo/Idh/MocA family oxidoreductase, partial [Roseimicrobium sp.]|nr:Gfo/Idh/MocA family oxidoreductase [Roseimicrobium sp.]
MRTAIASAAVVPFILPSRVWSAEVAPSKRITLGVIGTGKQARGLMSGFLKMKDFQTIAVCDVDTNRRNNARKITNEFYAKENNQPNYDACNVYSDFRELLDRKDIDAVVIATPDHWHALIAIAAARAGKDIYCEKPLCQSIHEARAMVEATRKNGRIFQVGSMQRSSREFRIACELVRNNVIGRIKTVTAGVGGP